MVKQKVLIDTSIIIGHLRVSDKQDLKSQLQTIIENKSIIPFISTTTIQELFAGQSSKNTIKEGEIKKLLGLFRIVPVTSKIAELAGKLMRDNQTIIKFADAQIMSTAILEKAYLATGNVKDFTKIKGVIIYDQY